MNNELFQINKKNAPLVANLMNEIKPDWWSINGALEQIAATDVIGWYMAEREESKK